MAWGHATTLPAFARFAAAFVAASAIGGGARAQSSSPEGARLAFVTGYVESCTLKSAQAIGAGFTRQEVETYCRCVAASAADELSPDEIKRMGSEPLAAEERSRLSARLEKAALHCAYKR